MPRKNGPIPHQEPDSCPLSGPHHGPHPGPHHGPHPGPHPEPHPGPHPGPHHGPAEFCACHKCGLRLRHTSGIPCKDIRCPRCGSFLTRD